MIHNLMNVTSFILLPFLWISVVLVFGYEPISKLYGEWNQHRKSGENWGPFDEVVKS